MHLIAFMFCKRHMHGYSYICVRITLLLCSSMHVSAIKTWYICQRFSSNARGT